MYIDWVIALSLIIIVLTCIFLAYGVRYCVLKINQEVDLSVENNPLHR